MDQTPNQSFLPRMWVCGHSFPRRHHVSISIVIVALYSWRILSVLVYVSPGNISVMADWSCRGREPVAGLPEALPLCSYSKPVGSKTAFQGLLRVDIWWLHTAALFLLGLGADKKIHWFWRLIQFLAWGLKHGSLYSALVIPSCWRV